MEQDNLIYVAGNPDLYPLEYYDPDTGDFAGAIPEMLEDFAEASGYAIVYYQPGAEDRRDQLAENQQVDLISGCVAAEGERPYPHTVRRIDLYYAEADGETVTYSLFCTDVSPASFQQEITGYFDSLSRAELGGEVVAALGQEPPGVSLVPVAIGLGAAVLLLAAAVGLVYRRGRKRLQAVLRRLHTGPYNLLTEEGLSERFDVFVNDNNRVLYQLSYFRFAMDKIACLGGKDAPEAFSQIAASAIQNSLGPRDLAMRLGSGDMAVLKYTENVVAAAEWGRKLHRQLQAIPSFGGPFQPDTVALGIYPLRVGDHTFSSALYFARQCALVASETESGFLVGDDTHYRLWDEERQLLQDFSPALSREELQIWIQFLVSSITHESVGGEVCTRWKHPQRGELSPARYIPLLEREGRIWELDYNCLERTCSLLERLDQAGRGTLFFSCNISRATFSKLQFAAQCQEIIARHHFPIANLVLEVTESYMLNPDQQKIMLDNICVLRAAGVRIMFDDFGMGFSSYYDLQSYPMDGLKLDRSLVVQIDSFKGQTLLQSLITAGHALGLTMLAEGVEEPQQADALREIGCDFLQGFLFSVPVPLEEAERQLFQQPVSQKGVNTDDVHP